MNTTTADIIITSTSTGSDSISINELRNVIVTDLNIERRVDSSLTAVYLSEYSDIFTGLPNNYTIHGTIRFTLNPVDLHGAANLTQRPINNSHAVQIIHNDNNQNDINKTSLDYFKELAEMINNE